MKSLLVWYYGYFWGVWALPWLITAQRSGAQLIRFICFGNVSSCALRQSELIEEIAIMAGKVFGGAH